MCLRNFLKLKIFSFIFLSYTSYGQSCYCKDKKELSSIINCEKYYFSNGNSINWTYDCNGSYLIFENKEGSKILFDLEKELIELTGRLGYTYWQEFKNYFMITNKPSSGSQPAEYILFDKNSGEKIKYLGNELIQNEDYVVFVNFYGDDFYIILFDKNSNQLKQQKLPAEIIDKSVENSNPLHLIEIFDRPILNDEKIVLELKNSKENNKEENIKLEFSIDSFNDMIDLKKINTISKALKKQKITISFDEDIDSSKLDIKMIDGLGGWHTTIYNIFLNNELDIESLPKSKGIYKLNINYGEELTYTEIFIYLGKTDYEELQFNFYKENDRIFCQISSKISNELNKEIVLNPFSDEMKELFEELKKIELRDQS